MQKRGGGREMKKEDIPIDKIASMPADSKFVVKVKNEIELDRNSYLLYRVARQSYENQRASFGVEDMPFEEYLVRSYIATIGGKIIEQLEAQTVGRA
jgi:hypothetical protein